MLFGVKRNQMKRFCVAGWWVGVRLLRKGAKMNTKIGAKVLLPSSLLTGLLSTATRKKTKKSAKN